MDRTDELAAFGPFFAAGSHDPAGPSPRPGEVGDPAGVIRSAPWQPVRGLVDSPGVLDRRVDAVRASLGARSGTTVDLRVAVSVTHLGLVARLVAVGVGLAALGAGSPWILLDALWWRDRLGGPFPVSVARDVAARSGGVSAVEAVTRAVAGRYSIAGRVLWGNVASAANSAAMMIRQADPAVGRIARAAADTILSDPRVEGGTLRSSPGFRRASCCLIYRVSGSRRAVCGDCVLR